MTINATQVRMARAALRWSVRELAARVGVTPGTIVRIEAGKPAFESTFEKLEAVFYQAGLQCFVGEDGAIGIRVRPTEPLI